FSNSAQNLLKFYQESKGVKANGVIILDGQGLSRLLVNLGNIEPTDKKETKGKESLKEALDKLIYGSSKNLPKVVANLETPFREKHLMIYMRDPVLASFIDSENYGGGFAKTLKGERDEFLGVLEFVTGGKFSEIKRDWEFESTIDKNFLVKNKLTLTYANQNLSNPSSYSSRLRIYLPPTTNVTKV
ncbi:MAG: hypothetical protein Q7S88_03660, partial [Candidatus Daviesbacteria bacterium]|nr:hypothetical protein [Candidatus Daviesbacteria bacterium]